jgi:hypothetical protein
MRWRRRNNRKALKALVLSFAAMAILAGNANAAQVHDGGSIVAGYEQGGVTPANLARAYVQPGLDSALVGEGVTPANLARAYVQPGMEPSLSQADGSTWLPSEDVALGFGLGLILATAAAIALAMARNRERLAHS